MSVSMTDAVPDSFELPIELEKEFTSSICPTHSSSLLSAIHRQFKAQSVVDEYCTTDDGCESDCTTDFSSESEIGEEDRLGNIEYEDEPAHWDDVARNGNRTETLEYLCKDRLAGNINDEIEHVYWDEEVQNGSCLEAEYVQLNNACGYDAKYGEEDHRQVEFEEQSCTDPDHDSVLKDMVASRAYPIAILLQCRALFGRYAVDTCSDRVTCQVKPYTKEHYALPAKKPKSKGCQARSPSRRTQATTNRQMALAAQSVLGKLAGENAGLVLDQLMDLGFDRAEHVSLLLDQIFDLAVRNHQRLAVYGELCLRLANHPRITSMVYSTGKQLCFRRLLHTHCECVFQHLLNVFDKQNVSSESDQEWKQHALGSVKFIAQLLVIGLLPSNMLVECGEELLGRHDRCSESVEVLTALLMITGPKFDHVDWPCYSGFDALLSRMQLVARNKSIPSRARFLLRDILDVRNAGWALGTSLVPGQLVLTQVEQALTHVVVVTPQSGRQENILSNAEDDKLAQTSSNEPGSTESETFDVIAFRRALAGVLANLAVNRDVQVAVNLVRSNKVPLGLQADQFTDILTRVVEDRRGPCRRCALAFAVRIAADSVFDQVECLLGLSLFFQDVYPDLRIELPRLPAIVAKELLPALYAVFPKSEMQNLLPVDLQSQ